MYIVNEPGHPEKNNKVTVCILFIEDLHDFGPISFQMFHGFKIFSNSKTILQTSQLLKE